MYLNTPLIALVSIPQTPTRQGLNGSQSQSELERLVGFLQTAKIINNERPDDPLMPELASMIVETLQVANKFGLERDGGIHLNRDGQEIIVRFLTSFGEILIPKEIKVKGDWPMSKVVRGNIFADRPYFKLSVVIKYPVEKIGKKFSQPLKMRTLLIDQNAIKSKVVRVIEQHDD